MVPRTDETCRVTTGTAYATSTSAYLVMPLIS
ncbi:hypothetical protein Asd1617_03424 [Shigella dysenteriae 1617]|uniref:Uncharacterized protein n=1 Tax=Shigella dysenteriae 1617 TaxID=754093 RepID=A0A0A6ZX68_SHIDY|nr:hypothetical protein Asd1617_03424 [Shigella dysenteriae 1617]